ncbi:TolC family protein [Undibacterium sp. Jales W-56]|uniref:TolC family protein n=1 Tax=Undibacterium sp. Jales W-56 TaxID=2897325 RepID=UPI0021D0008C|nr:TolC family protein [Undibacterium sp. Jales W-56]MCU6435304.1 TolC family protein [Undibacterium sp. Jales W-56]
MQVSLLPLAAALFAVPLFASAANPGLAPLTEQLATAPVPPIALSLEQAIERAEAQNPELQRSLARRMAVEGEAVDARALFWNNPELAMERTRRVVPQVGLPSESLHEWQAGITQTIEIAGQQGHRRQATQQELEALAASIMEARLQLRGGVERQFVGVIALQARITTEQRSLVAIEETARAITKRVVAGEDSRLDGNLASVEAVRARNQIGLLQEQLMQARAELATLLQMPPGTSIEALGTLETPLPAYSLESLLTHAATRPLLRALDHREQAAAARLALERSARYPDVTVGVAASREGADASRERLVRMTLSVPLPLYRNNAGGIGRARTELAQAQIERRSTSRDAAADIHSLWQKMQSQTARVGALRDTALPALEENQRLSVKSLHAGEIGLTQLLLVNRQVLDGRRDLIDAQAELRITRIALQQAAGWSADAQR